MALTTITTLSPLNQQNALVLACYGYDQSGTSATDLKATLGAWVPIDSASNTAGVSLQGRRTVMAYLLSPCRRHGKRSWPRALSNWTGSMMI